jgi:Cu/Ag efflux pump CusA
MFVSFLLLFTACKKVDDNIAEISDLPWIVTGTIIVIFDSGFGNKFPNPELNINL